MTEKHYLSPVICLPTVANNHMTMSAWCVFVFLEFFSLAVSEMAPKGVAKWQNACLASMRLQV